MMVLHDYLKPGQVTYVTLETDLDMSEVTDWVPLNLGADTYEDKQYMNWINFDGKGHTIKGFRCTKKGDYYNSLFGVLCGAVYNLGLVDCEVDAMQVAQVCWQATLVTATTRIPPMCATPM